MNFSSLREYFYKLANRCYLLVLLPLGVFIYIYHRQQAADLGPFIKEEQMVQWIIAGLVLLGLINLTTVNWLSRKRLAKHVVEIGLGNKLDRYAEIIMFRMKACSATSLLMAVGLLITGHPAFAISFIIILALAFLQWPTARKACRALKLKGDEREMVLFKKDQL